MATSKKKPTDKEIRVNWSIPDLDSDVGNQQERIGVVTPREKALFRMSMVRTACAVGGVIFNMVSSLIAVYMAWKVLHMGR